MDLENKNIDIREVKKLYDSMIDIWPQNDKWYAYTYKRIQRFLKKWEKRLKWNNSIQVLNAGSGGNTYGISGHHLHLDITSTHIQENQDFIISSSFIFDASPILIPVLISRSISALSLMNKFRLKSVMDSIFLLKQSSNFLTSLTDKILGSRCSWRNLNLSFENGLYSIISLFSK